jgi:hypothetical protein
MDPLPLSLSLPLSLPLPLPQPLLMYKLLLRLPQTPKEKRGPGYLSYAAHI